MRASVDPCVDMRAGMCGAMGAAARVHAGASECRRLHVCWRVSGSVNVESMFSGDTAMTYSLNDCTALSASNIQTICHQPTAFRQPGQVAVTLSVSVS